MSLFLRLSGICIGMFALTGAASGADQFEDWRVGDFIFYESTSPQAYAIRVATGSRYTHMGIVDRTEDGFHVIEAGLTVTHTPLTEFVAKGVGGEYAVYRVAELSEDQAVAALNEAETYYGLPYDIFFRLEPDAIYCSELPYHAFGAVGIELGTVERLGDLAIDTPEGREIFLARWQDHPDCRENGLDRDGCWSLVESQEIVTPVSIARDPQVERVFSSFDPEE